MNRFGTGKWLRFVVSMWLLILAACSAPPDAEPAAILPTDLPLLRLEPVPVDRERILDGIVSAASEATLSAQTAARVIELPFEVNDRVNPGDVVVRLTDTEQQAAKRQATGALRAAKARSAESDADFLRVQEIQQRGLVALAALDRAKATRDAHRAEVESAVAALRDAEAQLQYTEVRAPYSGVLTQRHVRVGESVQPGQALVSGLSTRHLRVEVDVAQADVAAIRASGKAFVEVASANRLEVGSLIFFPHADRETHQQTLRLELPDTDVPLQPGKTVKVHFVLGRESLLMIPERSVLRQGNWQTAFVLRDGQLRPRQLRLGRKFGSDVEVIAGLEAGDQIVTDYLRALDVLDEHGRQTP